MNKIAISTLILLSIGITNAAWAEKACFEVQGMTCATCPITVKAAVKKLVGINSVDASLKDKSTAVDFDSKKTNESEIMKAIDNVGYKATRRECKKNG